jgi:Domain of unknown function (DUF4956)
VHTVTPLAASLAADSAAGAGVRFLLDVAAMSVLTLLLFLPRHRRRDLVTVFWLFNVALFAVLLVIGGGGVSVGAGLGLFGVLSIVRLRSEQYRNVEIGYFFVALAIALVSGLAAGIVRPVLIVVLVLLVTAIVDWPRLFAGSASMDVLLDTVHDGEPALREDLERRLGHGVEELSVLEVDYVRMTTRLTVRVSRDARPTRLPVRR